MADSNLDLRIRPPLVVKQERQSVAFRGFLAERVVVGGEVAYDYQSTGADHYLAIHDIQLKDGEIQPGDAPPEPVTELFGRITFVPRGCPLSGWASTRNRTNAFTSISFGENVVAQELERNLPTVDNPLIHFKDPRLEATLWRLDAALKQPGQPEALYLETLALTAIMELGHYTDQLPTQPLDSGRLSQANERMLREFVDQNLSADITLAAMAEIAGLSRYHFSRAFKATFGASPLDYVIRARVMAATQMLANTESPIAEIATAVGFSSPERLTAAFKKFAHQTPRQFRQRAK